jgi:hypothetical protein
MSGLLGTSIWVFLGMTVVLAGGAAWMTGQAIAGTWRPYWQIPPYTLLLALSDRFLIFALFGGELLSLSGFLIDWAALLGLATLAFRLTRVHVMLRQYPWLYERDGLFGWRERAGGAVAGDRATP